MFTIRVTQEHIDQAERNKGMLEKCRSQSCAIALATQEKFPLRAIIVGPMYLFLGSSRRIYILPDKAQNFIYDVDMGLPVQPFQFQLLKS